MKHLGFTILSLFALLSVGCNDSKIEELNYEITINENRINELEKNTLKTEAEYFKTLSKYNKYVDLINIQEIRYTNESRFKVGRTIAEKIKTLNSIQQTINELTADKRNANDKLQILQNKIQNINNDIKALKIENKRIKSQVIKLEASSLF